MARSIKEAGNNILTDINKRLEVAGRTVLRDAIRECPIDQGQLRASGRIESEKDKVKVTFNTEYAYYVHESTGIYNANGRKTSWVYPYKGGFRKTKGMKGKPFLKIALNKNKDKISEILKG